MLQAGQPPRPLAADAVCLPFPPATFDALISGFLVRNLADVRAGLAEQVRVLRPGGRLVVLETTPGPGGPVGWLFRLYFRGLVPRLGGLIAGDAAAYTYLPESAAAFLEPERLVDLLRELGLTDVSVRRLGLGSVAIVAGLRPGSASP
jgi:demethylmenaquinone methyltransferase/2-methoxy-6-polyprenyl-1,4-benzoquinol methylase